MFTICHINVRSLSAGFHMFRDYYSVTALSETWLTPDTPSDCYRVPSYELVRVNRFARGGSMFYIH